MAKSQVRFVHKTPSGTHFGGTWEREVRAIETALHAAHGGETVTDEVLRTVLIKVEEILNAKHQGYVSTDVSDPDPVTPNILLMGRLDASLPQVVFRDTEFLSNRRWCHSHVLVYHFWSHFIKSHLPNLQQRQKWMTDTRNFLPSIVIMVMDPQLPKALWPIGWIQNTLPAQKERSAW